MRPSIAFLLVLAASTAQAGPDEDLLLKVIETRKDPAQRNEQTLASVKHLIERVDLTFKTSHFETFLHLLVANGDEEAVDLSLALEPDLEARDVFERTPLLTAIVYKRYNLAHTLIFAGADALARDVEGKDAIQLLEAQPQTADVVLLLEVLRAPRSQSPSVLVHPSKVVARPPEQHGAFEWLTPLRAAGVAALAVVAFTVVRNSGGAAE